MRGVGRVDDRAWKAVMVVRVDIDQKSLAHHDKWGGQHDGQQDCQLQKSLVTMKMSVVLFPGHATHQILLLDGICSGSLAGCFSLPGIRRNERGFSSI